MARNAIDLTLLAAILVGGVFAFRVGRERTELAAHHARLVAAAGELPVEDPTLIYLKALDTGDPLHFAWRVHLPANINLRIQSHMASGSSSGGWSNANPQDLIARVRLLEDEPGQVSVYTRFAGGSSRSGYGDAALARFLREHTHDLKVEQIGRTGVTTIDPNAPKPTVLLRVGLPEAIRPPDLPKWISSENFLDLMIGAPGSFPP